MIELIVLGLFLLYLTIAILITRALVRAVSNKSTKWRVGLASGVVFFLIPTWDVILGRAYFLAACSTKGGLNIYKTVGIGEDYYVPNLVDAELPDGKKMEIGAVYKLRKYDRDFNVKLVPGGGKLKAEYDYAVAKDVDGKFLGVQGVISYAKVKGTNEVLGEATSFLYWGGWVANYSGMHVSAIECPNPPTDENWVHKDFLEKIFRPKKL